MRLPAARFATGGPMEVGLLGNERLPHQIPPMTTAELGDVIDERMLRERVKAEHADDALDALWAMARSGARIGEVDLRELLDRLHGRREGRGE